ncbi:MAG: hypothetical protein Q4G24_08915 [Paracoccus sp. (in: a-proteobacteria)]|uniref:hypothetical protein n=1 Tax=Paracoccus sp. TaxID=267 RepID=UPI0026DF790E|nr:hypothetical protein [Paracoccus sp. (in: a-proteobacteria)]MDO5621575.1 hypothetical protein [Paracoccus sp. (in: a-proteobacteria)]
MVTSVTAMGNAAAPALQSGTEQPMLSDLAQHALKGLGKMHMDFAASAQTIQTQVAPPAGAGPATDMAQQVRALQDSYHTALQVQHQIMQFSMATSISQTLGNNLNSFLKGA